MNQRNAIAANGTSVAARVTWRSSSVNQPGFVGASSGIAARIRAMAMSIRIANTMPA